MTGRFGLCLLALAGSVQAVPIARTQPTQISNWPASQTGEMNLRSGEFALPVAVAADGKFKLDSPKLESLEGELKPILSFFKTPTLASICTGKGSAVPTNARYTLFTLNTINGAEIRFQTPDGHARALLMYLTRPTTLRGILTCENDVYHVSGTYHAGLVLVPMISKEQDGKTTWHWDDMLNVKNFQWMVVPRR